MRCATRLNPHLAKRRCSGGMSQNAGSHSLIHMGKSRASVQFAVLQATPGAAGGTTAAPSAEILYFQLLNTRMKDELGGSRREPYH